MADIRDKILSKYNIDIAKTNIIKLYKIEFPDISTSDLEIKIAACRKKWIQSINGANEKFAERDKAHLEKADKYEEILRDNKIRKELFSYYDKTQSSDVNTSFAKNYFKMISLTKKIDKNDVEFYFTYFQNERKNKKSILEMLKTEFKVYGLGKEEKFSQDDTDEKSTGKTKIDSSPLITNLFQEATLIKIHKCESFLETALQSADVKNRYSKANEDLYSLLEIDGYKDINPYSEYIAIRRDEAANYKYDRGQEFTPIMDLFNTVSELLTYKDVIDNFSEFKLLLKYPKLTPYMFVFEEIKPSSLKEFYDIASIEYSFIDMYDFILNYFQPIYDNFGIVDKGLNSILKKAKKQTKANNVLKSIDEILGIDRTNKVPFGINLVHYAVYWPIYILYLVFEIFKAIITEMRKVTYPLFAVTFIGLNWFAGNDGIFVLRHILNKDKWHSIISPYMGGIGNTFEIIVGSLAFTIDKFSLYVLPPLLIALIFYNFSIQLSKSVDWIGLERTFQEVFKTLRVKTKKQYTEKRKEFIKTKVPHIVINIICVLFLGTIINFVPIKNAIFNNSSIFSKNETENVSSIEINEVYMVITADKANIRSGAGTNYSIITTATKGTQFLLTGNQTDASNGRTWFEIYLNPEKTQTGWASSSVASFTEN